MSQFAGNRLMCVFAMELCATVTVTGNSSGERVCACVFRCSSAHTHTNTKIIQLTCQNVFDEVICVKTL